MCGRILGSSEKGVCVASLVWLALSRCIRSDRQRRRAVRGSSAIGRASGSPNNVRRERIVHAIRSCPRPHRAGDRNRVPDVAPMGSSRQMIPTWTDRLLPGPGSDEIQIAAARSCAGVCSCSLTVATSPHGRTAPLGTKEHPDSAALDVRTPPSALPDLPLRRPPRRPAGAAAASAVRCASARSGVDQVGEAPLHPTVHPVRPRPDEAGTRTSGRSRYTASRKCTNPG